MIYLKGFKLSSFIDRNPNAYPDRILRHVAGEVLLFDKITIIYGDNGAGKSTLLNVIANKLSLQGKENMKGSGSFCYAERFLEFCHSILGEDGAEQPIDKLPPQSRYIKSEDLLYEVKKIQDYGVLRDYLIAEQKKSSTYPANPEQELNTNSYSLQQKMERIKFAQEKYSNGETALQLFEEMLLPGQLYLLDEPETSLSPQNQIKLAEQINQLARYSDCQFIIATHSPFLLGLLEAKIYNLDAATLTVTEWYKLEHIKCYYQFFQEKAKFFDS